MSESHRPLLDQVLRNRIYASVYWKQDLFAATAETVLQHAARLNYIGTTYGPFNKPTKFLCLLLKLFHIAPSPETLFALLSSKKLKYLVVLALFYVRFAVRAEKIYATLEDFLADYRKVVVRDRHGKFELLHVDEIVETLLNEDRVLGVPLPRLTSRKQLVTERLIGPRVSPLAFQGELPEAEL